MPPPKPIPPLDADHPTQSQRFIDMAREVEADEAPEALDRALEKVIKPTPPGTAKSFPKAEERGK